MSSFSHAVLVTHGTERAVDVTSTHPHFASHMGPQMTITTRVGSAAAAAALTLTGIAYAAPTPAAAHSTGLHDNCTNFNKKFPHGVGRVGANDRGGNVTNFKRSNRIYNTAERHNGDLDRDNDRIACEKA